LRGGQRRPECLCRLCGHRTPEDGGHPSRSDLARGQRGNPDGVRAWLGEADRKEGAQPQRAQDDPTSQCRRAERRQDPEASQPFLLAGGRRALAGYGAWCPGPKGRPRGSGEPVKGRGVATREPKDTLDASAAAGVNGPEGEALAWRSVDWPRVEGDVRRLRRRIFTGLA
jgi:hypothetical protein